MEKTCLDNEGSTLNHKLTFGEKAADSMTKWIGSWTFIILFIIFLLFWMIVNTYFFIKLQSKEPFDPYPFIFLNLVLSSLGAIQAPIILMSQNREDQKDRIRSKHNYAINKKAEKEIREIKYELERIEKKLK